MIEIFRRIHKQELSVVSRSKNIYPEFTVYENLESVPMTVRGITNIPVFWKPGPVYTRYTDETTAKTEILNEIMRRKYGYDCSIPERMPTYKCGVQPSFKKLRAFLNDCGVKDIFTERWTAILSFPFPNEV